MSTDPPIADPVTNWPPPYDVPCPRCRAKVGEPCRKLTGGDPSRATVMAKHPHRERRGLPVAPPRPMRRPYMKTSRFERGFLTEVIWLGDEPIVGPFCKHCGNPWHVHGPDGECLPYRIHPLLPLGDLPPAPRPQP